MEGRKKEGRDDGWMAGWMCGTTLRPSQLSTLTGCICKSRVAIDATERAAGDPPDAAGRRKKDIQM
jgi:hypothetical protein